MHRYLNIRSSKPKNDEKHQYMILLRESQKIFLNPQIPKAVFSLSQTIFVSQFSWFICTLNKNGIRNRKLNAFKRLDHIHIRVLKNIYFPFSTIFTKMDEFSEKSRIYQPKPICAQRQIYFFPFILFLNWRIEKHFWDRRD